MTTPDETGTPGKTRTWWHPLLVRLLEYALAPAFEVRDEVSVGTLPLRADIVLVRREQGELPELARRSLPALAERLNQWTLIEFKSPVDSLERGDLDRLVGVAHLFCAQQPEPIASADLSLVILAPSTTKPFEEDVTLRGLVLAEDEPGVFRIEGGLFAVWLLEADRLTGPGEPVMTAVSRVFLREGRHIIGFVRQYGEARLLLYTIQQIEQFHQLGDAFMVQHTHTAEMDQEYAALKEAFVESLSPEERLAGLSPDDEDYAVLKEMVLRSLPAEERLAGLSPGDEDYAVLKEMVLRSLPAEERLAGLSAEERLAGLSAEERLAGISPEDALEAFTPEQRAWLLEAAKRGASRPPEQ